MASEPMREREFADIIRQYSTIINKVSYFYATERINYEDIRQDILVNIWQALPRFRRESRMSTWIYRIAVNSALMAIRSSKHKMENTAIDIEKLNLSTEFDDEQRENLQQLYSLIDRLEPIDKAIILLWLDEYTYEEIADTIGLNKNSVGVRIHRIKEKLSKSF